MTASHAHFPTHAAAHHGSPHRIPSRYDRLHDPWNSLAANSGTHHTTGNGGGRRVCSALGLEHGPGAVLRTAPAGPDLLQPRSVRFVQGDAVVVSELFARPDGTPCLDEDLRFPWVCIVFLQHRLAVGLATVVDPARGVAAVVGVDHVVVVEGEEERVATVRGSGVSGIDFRMGAALALVLDDALALGDWQLGENAVAVDGGFAGDDLAWHADIPGVRPTLSPAGVSSVYGLVHRVSSGRLELRIRACLHSPATTMSRSNRSVLLCLS